MFLIEHLKEKLETQESMFEQQLIREDISRLEKLNNLIDTAANLEEFRKAGMVIGWTKGDLRTFEMKEPLTEFLRCFYAFQTNGEEKDGLVSYWQEFNALRRKILLHCL